MLARERNPGPCAREQLGGSFGWAFSPRNTYGHTVFTRIISAQIMLYYLDLCYVISKPRYLSIHSLHYCHMYVKYICRFEFLSHSQGKPFAHNYEVLSTYYVVLSLKKYTKFATVIIIYSAPISRPDMKGFPSITDEKIVPLNEDDICCLNINNVCVKLFKELFESEMMLLIETTHTPLLKDTYSSNKNSMTCSLYTNITI